LRKSHPVFRNLNRQNLRTTSDAATRLLTIERWSGEHRVLCLLNFGKETLGYSLEKPGNWKQLLSSASSGKTPSGDVPAQEPVQVPPESILILEQAGQ
ncbi:MAG TPA: DUF3459 domain-containing protein, partial [Adhaeribacter sp.]|nr:DUF3459 domain-containing protein [Adhaeribacter sp.]